MSELLHARSISVRTAAVAGAVALCLGTAACSSSSKATGGGSTPPAATGANGAPTVHVKNFTFDPGTVTIKSGAKVTWVFEDSSKHNVTATDKSFKSADLSSGGTYSTTFNTAGTYSYFCSIHQYMTGKVIVR